MAHNQKETNDTHYFGVGLLNTLNGFNIGAVIRTVGNFNGSFMFVTGNRFNTTDPRTGHKKSDFRNTDTEQTRKKIPVFLGVPSVEPFIPHDCEVCVLERNFNSTNLVEFKHPRRCVYLFGPEDGSVMDYSLTDKKVHSVYVPTHGSMNLAHCVTTVLYDRTCKGIDVISERRCPKCGNEWYKSVSENLLHCNGCGYEGQHVEWESACNI